MFILSLFLVSCFLCGSKRLLAYTRSPSFTGFTATLAEEQRKRNDKEEKGLPFWERSSLTHSIHVTYNTVPAGITEKSNYSMLSFFGGFQVYGRFWAGRYSGRHSGRHSGLERTNKSF